MSIPPKATAFPVQVYSAWSWYWLVLALSRVITLRFLLIEYFKACVLFQVSPHLYQGPESSPSPPHCEQPHLARGAACSPWQRAVGTGRRRTRSGSRGRRARPRPGSAPGSPRPRAGRRRRRRCCMSVRPARTPAPPTCRTAATHGNPKTSLWPRCTNCPVVTAWGKPKLTGIHR